MTQRLFYVIKFGLVIKKQKLLTINHDTLTMQAVIAGDLPIK